MSSDHSGESLQLSIIIVNHRAEAILPECLRALADSCSAPKMEVIVVDNPAEGNVILSDFPDGIVGKRLSLPRRVGFAAACNRGADESGGKYLLFINPDVIVESSAIADLYEAVTENPEAGIVVGRLVGRDGKFQPSCRRFPTLGNLFLSRGSFLHKIFHLNRDVYTLPDYRETTAVDAAAAAMMMFSRNTFDLLRGFDERFFLYMEDTDLCYRAAQAGVQVFYVPRAAGRHYWGYSTRQYRFRRIWWHHISIWRYFIKHHRSPRVVALLGPMLLINSFLSLVAELFTLRK